MNVACLFATALFLIAGLPALAQDEAKEPTRLAGLLEEAQKNNAELVAAEHAWRAAGHVGRQVTTLPDPQFTVQQFSVGSPKPFAGFTNSNFAYIGFGASQQLPYPGKLRLKGQVADREADAQHAHLEELRAAVAHQVKTTYFHLAYLQQTLDLLQRTGNTLKQVADTELSRYRVGQGSQSDVLNGQLERTKLLREITLRRADMGQYQAELKLLLHRPQGSPDIVPEDLRPTTLAYAAPDLLALVQGHNPGVQSERAVVDKQDARLKSAERARKPDFNLGYMFQETGPGYRDYYMLTFSMSLPRRKRVNAQVAEAAEMLEETKASLDAQLQQQLAEVQKQYVTATGTGEELTEYRDGLIPQAESVLRASLAAYQSASGDLRPVLLAITDVLSLQREADQVLLDHEIAISNLETLTGETLQ